MPQIRDALISIVLVDAAGALSLHHPSREGCEVQNLNLGPRESRVEDAARASLLSDSCGDAVKVPIEGDHRIRPPVPHDRDRRPIREAQRPAAGTAKHFQSAEERLLPDELEGNPRGARIGGHDEVEGTDRCRVTTRAGEQDRDDLVQDEIRRERLRVLPAPELFDERKRPVAFLVPLVERRREDARVDDDGQSGPPYRIRSKSSSRVTTPRSRTLAKTFFHAL